MIATIIRKILSLLMTALLLLLLLLAVYVSLGRQLLPFAADYRSDVESRLSAALGQQIRIGSIRGDWNRLNPVLALQQVQLLTSENPAGGLVLGSVSLELDVLSSLFARSWTLASVDVLGSELTLRELEDGRWQMDGFEPRADATLSLEQILTMTSRVNDLALSNVALTVQRKDGRTLGFERSRLRLQNRGSQHYLHLDAWQNGVVGPLSVAFEFTGERLEELVGQVYVLLPENDYSEILADSYADTVQLNFFQGGGEVLADIADGQLHSLQGRVTLDSLRFLPQDRPGEIAIESLSSRFFARRSRENWEIALSDFGFQWHDNRWNDSNFFLLYDPDETIHVQADSFNLGIATGLLAQSQLLPPDVTTQLVEHNPRGEIFNLDMHWSLQPQARTPASVDAVVPDLFKLTANLREVNVSARRGAPALWGINGYSEVSYNTLLRKLTGFVEVESSEFMIQLPELFNDPWAYDRVNGRVNFQLDLTEGQHLQLSSGVIVAESDILNGRVRFATDFRKTQDRQPSSELELMVGALSGDVSRKTPYLPTAPKVPENLRKIMSWIESSVLAGRTEGSGLIFRGSILPDVPSVNRTLQMFYNVDNGTLRFDPQWPALDKLRGHVVINDRNVDIKVESGQSLDIGFDATTASIRPDAGGIGSWLSVSGRGSGAAQQGLSYLLQTPVTRGFGAYMADWQAEGSVDMNLDLRIPLGVAEALPQVNVTMSLLDNALSIPEFDLNFTRIGGQLNYNSAAGLVGEKLSAVFFDAPVAVSVRSGVDAERVSSTIVELAGSVEILTLREWPQNSQFVRDLLRRTSGQMNYLARLDIIQPAAAEGQDIPPQSRRLSISTDLAGINLDYPAPFSKSVGQSLPTTISIDFQDEQQELQLTLGDIATVNVGLAEGQIRNGLVFLGKRDEGLTVRRLNASAPGLDVLGSLQQFDYQQWLTALRQEPESGGNAAASSNFSGLRDAINLVDVTIADAVLFGQNIESLNVQIAGEEQSWKLSLSSATVSGVIGVPYRAGVPLDVHLAHLQFPVPEATAALQRPAGLDENGQPLPAPVVVERERVDPLLEFDPRQLPRMNFKADKVTRGEADYGRWQFYLDPIPTGAEFSRLLVESRGLRAGREGEEARFLWSYDGRSHNSSLNAVLDASNMAEVLSAFGYAPSLESTSAVFHANLEWPGSPAFFAAGALSGDLDMRVTEGRFIQDGGGPANGALKLISIINFDAIVRRLRFSDDLLRRGLSFEEIYGSMTLSKGIVNIIDRLQIIGPASLFQVAGQLDLAQQTIDGSMYITLPISDNIPWLSGIAVLNNLINWQVAVGVFLFDQIFGDQVDSLTSAQYTLQGPWEGLEPKLNQVFGTPSTPASTDGSQLPVPAPAPPATAPVSP